MGAIERPQHTDRLSDAIARRLELWISEQKLEPGTQLPTEKVLCERFGVSRAVIREAIARLKADGCVRTRQGSGAFVAALPGHASFRLTAAGDPGPQADEPPQREVFEVFELRYLIESGAAELAAQRRTEADLMRMRAALALMDQALASGADAVMADDEFHVAVAAATRNPQLERLQAFMGRQLSESRAPTWSAPGHRSGRARQAQLEHQQIYAAIAAGDAEAARDAAATHLIGAASRLGLDPMHWRATEFRRRDDEHHP